jgi:hypothetical protein
MFIYENESRELSQLLEVRRDDSRTDFPLAYQPLTSPFFSRALFPSFFTSEADIPRRHCCTSFFGEMYHRGINLGYVSAKAKRRREGKPLTIPLNRDKKQVADALNFF